GTASHFEFSLPTSENGSRPSTITIGSAPRPPDGANSPDESMPRLCNKLTRCSLERKYIALHAHLLLDNGEKQYVIYLQE
ncbi:MAG: hypothetical protein PSV22_16315, partial [Pseudolabrys sp.]|nr:hypothetical protein [Pseudolabrys sp.]